MLKMFLKAQDDIFKSEMFDGLIVNTNTPPELRALSPSRIRPVAAQLNPDKASSS